MKEILTYTIEAGPIRAVVWEVLYVVALLLVLSVVLDRLLFKPVLAVLDERARRLAAATGGQEETMRKLEEGARTHAERLAAAHREAEGRLAAARRAADELKQRRVSTARAEAESSLAAARARVTRQVAAAEAGLREHASAVARMIASRLLGREVA